MTEDIATALQAQNQLLTQLVEAVNRIADAVDKPKASEQKAETPFPWEEMGTRVLNAIGDRRLEKSMEFAPPWPWSCEDLLSIGKQKISTTRRLGRTSVEKIEQALLERGFKWL